MPSPAVALKVWFSTFKNAAYLLITMLSVAARMPCSAWLVLGQHMHNQKQQYYNQWITILSCSFSIND
jgi:hypothetical protein